MGLLNIDMTQMLEAEGAFGIVSGEKIQTQFKSKLVEIVAKIAAEASAVFPQQSGAAADSIVADQTILNAGGETAPYFGWVEFGGTRRGRGGGEAMLPYAHGGHYLYPTIKSHMEELQQAASDSVDLALGDAGFMVS